MLGLASGVLGGLLWGFSGTCAQFLYANYDIDALFMTMVRSVTAAVIFFFLLAFRHRETVRELLGSRRRVIRVAVFGVALLGSQLTYLLSVGATNAGTATVLQMSYAAFLIIYTSVASKALPNKREVAAFACAVAGTWAIATQGDLASLALPAIGIVYGMLNGICEAAYVLVPKQLFDRFGSVSTTGVGMMVNALLAVVAWVLAGAFDGGLVVPSIDLVGILVLVGGVGVVGTCLAFGLYLHGVAVVGSVTGGLLGALEPIGAMAFTTIWLGTAFTGADWIGLILMLTMLAIITVPTKEPTQKS